MAYATDRRYGVGLGNGQAALVAAQLWQSGLGGTLAYVGLNGYAGDASALGETAAEYAERTGLLVLSKILRDQGIEVPTTATTVSTAPTPAVPTWVWIVGGAALLYLLLKG